MEKRYETLRGIQGHPLFQIRRFRTLQEMVLDANSTLSNPSRKRHRVKVRKFNVLKCDELPVW